MRPTEMYLLKVPIPTNSGPQNAKPADEALLKDANAEAVVGVTAEDLGHLMLLESVKGFGPQKFRELYSAQLTPEQVITAPSMLPTAGKRGEAFRDALAQFTPDDVTRFRSAAVRQIAQAYRSNAKAVLLGRPNYPLNVEASNNPIPLLWVHGDINKLGIQRAVACVGSRNIGDRYQELHRAFVMRAASMKINIVSGFALGADTVGHTAARDAGGVTVCVMPCGLDRPFPPENKSLWREFSEYQGAVMVSEFPFGTGAASLTLRKRNKLIVALGLGVLISQSSLTGGAMNAYRFALEQKKPVATFCDDGTEATSGNTLIGNGYPKGTVFGLDQTDTKEWDTWLSQLCSGI
jgi:DNA protecting protein DprA